MAVVATAIYRKVATIASKLNIWLGSCGFEYFQLTPAENAILKTLKSIKVIDPCLSSLRLNFSILNDSIILEVKCRAMERMS